MHINKVLFILFILLTDYYMAGLHLCYASNEKFTGLELTPDEEAWCQAHPVIRIGTMANWPPLNFVAENGQPAGIGADYIALLNKRLNGALRIVPGMFKENPEQVKQGKLDGLMDITPKLEIVSQKRATAQIAKEISSRQIGSVFKNVAIIFAIIFSALFLTWLARGRPKKISIRATLFGILFVFAGLTVSIGVLAVLLLNLEKQLADIETRRNEYLNLAYELKQSSDDLTRFARTFVVTGKPEYEHYFQDILDIRDGIIPHPKNNTPAFWDHVSAGVLKPEYRGEIYSIEQRMSDLGLSRQEQQELSMAKKKSDDLTSLEAVAMNAVKGLFDDGQGNFIIKGKPENKKARQLLHGDTYHQAKTLIMKHIDNFLILIKQRTQREMEQAQGRSTVVLLVITALTFCTVFFAFISFFLLKRRIITPLYLLKSGARRLEKGDYAHHITTGSEDEVGDLANAFNAMTDSIKERTTRLHSIIDTAVDAIVVVSSRGIIQTFSPAAEKIFGYRATDMIGRNISALMPDSIAVNHDDYIRQSLETMADHDKGKHIETLGRKKNGETFPVSISISLAAVGQDRFFTGIIRDITEQKLLEDARRSSLKLNQIADKASIEEILEQGLEEGVRLTESKVGYLHFVDIENQTVELQTWSKNVRSQCEVKAGVSHFSIGNNGIWADCVHDKMPLIINNDKTMSAGFPGGHVPVLRHMAAPILEKNDVVAIIGVGNKGRDYVTYDVDILSLIGENIWSIVRRKKIAATIVRNEERLKLVLKGGNLGYWDTNLLTHSTIVNEIWAKMFGKSLDEITDIYKFWKSSVHSDDIQKVLDAGKDYLTGKISVYEIEYRIITRDKKVRWLVSRGSVVEWENDKTPLRMVGTLLDITESKKIEKELRQNMEDLQRFRDIAIGREERMIDLKQEINGLLTRQGNAAKYTIH